MDTMKLLSALLSNSNGAGASMLTQVLGSAVGGNAGAQQAKGMDLGSMLGMLQGAAGTMQGQGHSQPQASAGSGGGGLAGALSQGLGRAGGLEAILGGLAGGSQAMPQANAGGGLGGLLAGLTGATGTQNQGLGQLGGLADLLGAGGGQDLAGGGLGSIFSAALGTAAGAPTASNALQGMAREDQDKGAMLMIRAMLNAAKADGQVDNAERQALAQKLQGQLSQAEMDFVNQELNAHMDLTGFVQDIPRGAEEQVYAFSLMGMKLDTQAEADYMARLAKALRIDAQTANKIHEQMGAPTIF